MDLGNDIHTPTKVTYPQITGPNSHISAQSSSWQVYSRKGGGKKKQAHMCVVNDQRTTITSEITRMHPDQQHKVEEQTEDQLSNSMQQHVALPQVRSDGIYQTENHNQDAENIWSMVTGLGMTTRNSQKNYVQQLMEMERRDVDEAERLGSRRLTQ